VQVKQKAVLRALCASAVQTIQNAVAVLSALRVSAVQVKQKTVLSALRVSAVQVTQKAVLRALCVSAVQVTQKAVLRALCVSAVRLITMNEERRHDEALATFTDALLEGAEMHERERPALAETVEVLARTLEPEAPPERLRRQVLAQIRAEWGKEHRAERRSLGQQVLDALRSLGRSRQRRVWAAAAALLVAAVGVALVCPAWIGGATGTAHGGTGATALAIGLLLAGGIALTWFVLRRRS
jgi:hypothetical protein